MEVSKEVFKKSNNVVSRPLKPETLVIPVRAGQANLNEVYLLNEVAGRMWELLDGHHTIGQIVEIITDEYEVSPEEANQDLAELVNHLENLAIVTKNPA